MNVHVMDNTSNHNKSWSDAEIRMYRNGDLSPRERHDLERAALDDPFLADALEGWATLPPGDTGLDDLRSRIATRVKENERHPPVAWFRRPALQVAAIVIGLAGIGLTVFYSSLNHRRPQENSGLAKTVTAPATPASAPQPPPADHFDQTAPATADSTALKIHPDESLSDALVAKAGKDVIVSRRTNAEKKAKAEMTVQNSATSDSALFRDIASAPPPSKAELPPPAERVTKDLRAVPAQDDRAAFLRTAADSLQFNADRKAATPQAFYKFAPPATAQPSFLVLSGRVTDNNHRPLAGASVFLNNAPKTITTTDASGYFNFRIRPRDTIQQMAVALVGYKQTLVPLNNNALINNVIQLDEAKAGLNEVVVTGYGAQRKETFTAAPSDAGKERLDSSWLKVAPVIGNLAYQQYLDTAKRSLKLDPTIFGTERISFQVDQKGQITEFKIEHSLSPAHDAGVIQLINTGPSWHLLHGRKGRAVVSVNFP
ncbi:MAG TPA: carboxypeptidase-like regulatory domain-containing protein [Puia sp.]|uniref:carboxypeptidase-like regulatory domain-containing protein n=1 Tax=Puia sp. TaxID=2045100 RepID=UPI002BC841A4|nr:carboxypeptidase-like regulatory domain-containing protein [Puia sp.]HVU97019.1 carboxypeptidase-like regulatory domain-containing protein [Puia sp.]